MMVILLQEFMTLLKIYVSKGEKNFEYRKRKNHKK